MKDMLKGKKILLGISGSLAAYKTPELIRRLQDQGASISVIASKQAQQFVSKLTLKSVAHGEVLTDDDIRNHINPMQHIHLVRDCDCYIVAPASANTMSLISQGGCNNLLTESVLACEKPLLIAPAMNHSMWLNPATQHNIKKIKIYGYHIISPEHGELGCGEHGPGRLADFETMIIAIKRSLTQPWLQGKRVCITAGPSCEDIDPIRYLSNRSSGRMGYALATAAYLAGAEVILISGPTSLHPPHGCKLIQVRSANDMLIAVKKNIIKQDIFISAAAVADYTPQYKHPNKIKKDQPSTSIELSRTTDILDYVSKNHPHIYTIGFAAETNSLLLHARKKLSNKCVDVIVANEISSNNGMAVPNNQVSILFKDGTHIDLPYNHKSIVAQDILAHSQQTILEYFNISTNLPQFFKERITMCLIAFSYSQYNNHPLILLANRDEFYHRPSQEVHTWNQPAQITAGKDLQHGGIWLGYNRFGQWGAITNYRAPKLYDKNKQSRGQILKKYLQQHTTAYSYAMELNKNSLIYNHFNVLIGDHQSLWYISSYQQSMHHLSPGIYGLCNGCLNEPWPKVVQLKRQFDSQLKQHLNQHTETLLPLALRNKLYDLMRDTTQASLTECPQTGLAPEQEQALSSIFIKSPHYGTINTSLLTLNNLDQFNLFEINHNTCVT